MYYFQTKLVHNLITTHLLDDSFQMLMVQLLLVNSYQTQILSMVYCNADVEFESIF